MNRSLFFFFSVVPCHGLPPLASRPGTRLRPVGAIIIITVFRRSSDLVVTGTSGTDWPIGSGRDSSDQAARRRAGGRGGGAPTGPAGEVSQGWGSRQGYRRPVSVLPRWLWRMAKMCRDSGWVQLERRLDCVSQTARAGRLLPHRANVFHAPLLRVGTRRVLFDLAAPWDFFWKYPECFAGVLRCPERSPGLLTSDFLRYLGPLRGTWDFSYLILLWIMPLKNAP